MNDKKKVLAVIAGPYRFYQILWIYNKYPQYRWSILLLQYGKDRKYADGLQLICERLNIFENIFRSEVVGENSKLGEQILVAAKMFFSYIMGRKKTFMKETVLKQTNGIDFDAFFIGCEYSILEGAIIGISDEKEVYILEEGIGDYRVRKKCPSLSLLEIVGFLFSKMGYFNPMGYFTLKGTKQCEKYISVPELLKYHNYKKINTLFTGSKEENHYFYQLLDQVYPMRLNPLEGYDIVFLTSPLSDFVKNSNEYINMLHDWFWENYKGKRIVIKKHPRDLEQYAWGDLDISFISADIPAEVFMEMLDKQTVVLMYTSTMLISLLQKKNNFIVVKFQSIHGEYERRLDYTLELLEIGSDRMVYL